MNVDNPLLPWYNPVNIYEGDVRLWSEDRG